MVLAQVHAVDYCLSYSLRGSQVRLDLLAVEVNSQFSLPDAVHFLGNQKENLMSHQGDILSLNRCVFYTSYPIWTVMIFKL